MKTPTWVTAPAAAAIAAVLLAGCGPSHGHPSAAAASSGRAAARAEASSSGGQAAKRTAAQIADACRPHGGWNSLYPGVPGAAAARTAFLGCEKIPKAKVTGWAICLGQAYAHAPKGGAPGTGPEDQRQTYLATQIGACTTTARGGKP